MSALNTVSTARRRLSLLAGSSLVAASLSALAFTAAPSAALAYDECAPSSGTTLSDGPGGAFDVGLNAATADTFICAVTAPSISYLNTNGNLTLQLQNNVATTTGGLVVAATGVNNVTISRIADTTSGDPSLVSTSGAGLQVTRPSSSTAGAITVTLSDNDDGDAPLTISGTTAGVLLQNAGTGAITFTTTNGAITASAGAAIEATSSATGNISVTNGSATSGSTYGIVVGRTGTVGNFSIVNNAALSGGSGALLVTDGAAATITNSATGVITGALTLNNAGTVSLTNSGDWFARGTNFLGAGATTFVNSAAVYFGGDATPPTTPPGTLWAAYDGVATTLDFGAGADVFTSNGLVAMGGGTQAAATLVVSNLEAWNHAWRVLFGSDAAGAHTDGVANDRIVAAGTVFTGSGSSRLEMDVDFTANQADCSAAVTADCFDLRGSSTAGATTIVVNNVGDPLATADRIVLVDVGGAGTSGASHFTLDLESTGYRLVGATPAIETGMFFYTLGYDAVAKQHALTAAAFNGRALELTRVGRAASEPWRAATDLWETRQVDLRDTLSDGAGLAPGVWLKVAGAFINEKRHETLGLAAGDVSYNTSAEQRTSAVVGGVDLVRGAGGDSAWVFGLTAGKLSSTLQYRAGASSEVELDGHSFGAYATLVSGPLFVDAIVNTTSLDMTHRGFDQDVEGSADSFGYQVEAGYRLLEVNGGGVHIEPLAAVTYVRSEVDDFDIGAVGVDFGEATSLRAGLGVRVAGAMEMDALTTKLSLTGRVWKELDGDNATTLSASFGDTVFEDPGLDTLGDVGVAIGLFTPGGRLSANLGYSLTFGDGYQNSDASLSVRFSF